MNCACVYVGPEAETELYNESYPKAAKPHTCNECKTKIRPGQKYLKVVGKLDGDFFTRKVCLGCLSLADTFFCEGFIFNRLWSDMEMHVDLCKGEISESAIARLTPAVRDKVCEIIEKAWDR
jgi:hypothetical protein